MKISLLPLLIGALIGTCEAQQMEPYGDMAKSVTMIFNDDITTLRQKIIENAGQLQGVEIDSKTGKPKLETTVLKPQSWDYDNTVQMNLECISVPWMPPKPPPQKISQGGGNITPLRSKIRIFLGCLKTNSYASVISIDREWTYRAWNHFPYTEIPLWKSAQDRQGSYPSDHDWLHKLAPGKEYPTEFSCVEYDSKILEILKTLPSKH
jgi:hypothetical protein